MPAREVVRTTCPRDCYDGCGISVHKIDGRVAKVVGDRSHPISRGTLCGKCALAYNGVWREHEKRLKTPLKRIGPKGEGRFAAIDWTEALELIATRLGSILDSHGAESIVHAHYTGTCSMLAGSFPMRFFNRLGATEVEPDTICNHAGHVALGYVFGDSLAGFDPKTIVESRAVLVWGANPAVSGPHVHKHWLAASGVPVVVVDPVRTETAAGATLHLQPFPGTDAVLAFAMLNHIRTSGHLDESFIEQHTVGWAELRAQVQGMTPEHAQPICGVPAASIRKAAELYSRGPALLWLGQGLQRQPSGGNIIRACAMLPVLTGNIGKPGAGVCYVNGSGARQLDADYVTAKHLRKKPTPSLSHMKLAAHLQSPAAQALICWNINIAASAPRQTELRNALRRGDLFTVVVDLFQTDTADFADLVLPAASFLEFDDLMVPYFFYYLSAQVKCEEPPGDALPNQEIFRRLAARMGFEEPELFESDRCIIDRLLATSGLDITFAELKHAGTLDPFERPLVQYPDLEFDTPSGKIEIASGRAESDGHPRVAQARAEERPEAGWFRLLSPAGAWLMNDSYGNDDVIRRTLGRCEVALHATDAQALGAAPGDMIELSNPTGVLRAVLTVNDDVLPGVALTHKGRWPKHEPGKTNVNVLNPGLSTDIGASSAVHGTLVQIRVIPAAGCRSNE